MAPLKSARGLGLLSGLLTREGSSAPATEVWVAHRVPFTAHPGQRFEVPQLGALSHPLFWLGGFPYYNRLQKKDGTLILTSLLEDLEFVRCVWPAKAYLPSASGRPRMNTPLFLDMGVFPSKSAN